MKRGWKLGKTTRTRFCGLPKAGLQSIPQWKEDGNMAKAALSTDFLSVFVLQSIPQWKEDGNTYRNNIFINKWAEKLQSIPQWKEDGNFYTPPQNIMLPSRVTINTSMKRGWKQNQSARPTAAHHLYGYNQYLNEKRMETVVFSSVSVVLRPLCYNQYLNEKRMETSVSVSHRSPQSQLSYNQYLNEKRMETYQDNNGPCKTPRHKVTINTSMKRGWKL